MHFTMLFPFKLPLSSTSPHNTAAESEFESMAEKSRSPYSILSSNCLAEVFTPERSPQSSLALNKLETEVSLIFTSPILESISSKLQKMLSILISPQELLILIESCEKSLGNCICIFYRIFLNLRKNSVWLIALR